MKWPSLQIIIVKSDKEADGENAGTAGIYLCNFQWIKK